MTDKFPAGPYIVANVHEADDMDADAHHEDTLGVYVKSDFDNTEESPSALCFMNHNWGGVEDIAKLFAAAPDLLSTLAKAEAHIVELYRVSAPHANEGAGNRFADADPTVCEIRAALSSATSTLSEG